MKSVFCFVKRLGDNSGGYVEGKLEVKLVAQKQTVLAVCVKDVERNVLRNGIKH